jgi:hypothetical protein
MTVLTSEPYSWPLELFDPPSFRIPERRIGKVYLTCTCWDSLAYQGVELVKEINTWHEAEGWHGICWHYVVDKSGNIMTGRPLEEVPIIDASEANGKSIVIATHGLWHFTTAQLKSVLMLCMTIDSTCTLEGKPVTFHGVCEILPIPNPMFKYKSLLGLNAKGKLMAHTLMREDRVAEHATLMQPIGERNDERLHGSPSSEGRDPVSSVDGQEDAR